MSVMFKIHETNFEIMLAGENALQVSPASRLTDAHREYIRKHKLALIDWLVAEKRIRDWLARIGETGPDIIGETVGRCRADPEVRAYFLTRVNTKH
ncbi:MAG: hypothetical protein ACRERU_01355 [Methylococcales bacterium]